MKVLSLILAFFLVIGCSSNDKGMALEKGTENYNLAQKISEKVPGFNPDENTVLVSTDAFGVSVGDVADKMNKNFGKNAAQITNQPVSKIKSLINEFAENITMSRLVMQEAKDAGIVVSDQEIDSTMAKQFVMMGGEEKFKEFISNNGVAIETVKEDVTISLTIKKYLDKRLEEEANVTEKEIDDAYNSDKTATVRHILLLTQGKSEEEKQSQLKKMQGLLEEAKSGKDFAEIAKEHSEDPGSKSRGGLYEKFPKGQMVPAFEEAAFNTPVGELSGIVETPYGYHILKVISREKEDRSREELKEVLLKDKTKNFSKTVYEDFKERYNYQAHAL